MAEHDDIFAQTDQLKMNPKAKPFVPPNRSDDIFAQKDKVDKLNPVARPFKPLNVNAKPFIPRPKPISGPPPRDPRLRRKGGTKARNQMSRKQMSRKQKKSLRKNKSLKMRKSQKRR